MIIFISINIKNELIYKVMNENYNKYKYVNLIKQIKLFDKKLLDTLKDFIFVSCHEDKKSSYKYIKAISNNNCRINSYAFAKSTKLIFVIIDNNIKIIGNNAFFNCKNLEMINIPKSTQIIEEYSFSMCYKLLKIIIPDTVFEIHNNAFSLCILLKYIKLSKNLKKINPKTFTHCESLERIIIPNGVDYIEEEAFSWCFDLSEVILSNTLFKINDSAFYLCSSLLNIKIPESVIEICDCAFMDCELLKLQLGNSIIRIGKNAFCNNDFSELYLPQSILVIDDYAFLDCNNINDVIIPDSIEYIGKNILDYCKLLNSIKLPLKMQDKIHNITNNKITIIEYY